MTKMYLNSLSSPEEDSKKLFFLNLLSSLNVVLLLAPGGQMCAKLLSCVWLFATPWTVAHWAPLSMGFSRQEHWSGLPCLPSGEPSQPRDQIQVSCIQVDFYHLSQQGSPGRQICYHKLIENKESYLRHTSF